MANLYQVTYTYIPEVGKTKIPGTDGAVSSDGNSYVDTYLTDYSVSGDINRTISQIQSITYTHIHNARGSSVKWTIDGELICGNEIYSFEDPQTIQFFDQTKTCTNIYQNSTFPLKNLSFNKITGIRTRVTSKTNTKNEPSDYSGYRLNWHSTTGQAISITITFLEESPTVYNPQIESFAMQRISDNGSLVDPEGIHARANFTLNLGKTSDSAYKSLKLYYSTNEIVTEADSVIDWSAHLNEINYPANLSLSPEGTWDISTQYNFKLVFQYGEETFSQTGVLNRAFATLHLSNCKNGGVSVGGFSSSTDETPKFECHHPAIFYGGIAQIGNNIEDTLSAFGIQYGTTKKITIGANRTATTQITFSNLYKDKNIIVIPSFNNTTNNSNSFCGCIPSVEDVTQNGCSIVVYNCGDAECSGFINWIAIGELFTGEYLTIKYSYPTTAMSSNNSSNCEVFSNSNYGGEYPEYKAFDGKDSTSWASKTKTVSDGVVNETVYLQIKIPISLQNIKVQIYARKSSYIGNPTAGIVQGSTDGKTFTNIGSFSDWSSTADNGELLGTVICDNKSSSYNYIRVVFSKGSSQNYIAIGEMKVEGTITIKNENF